MSKFLRLTPSGKRWLNSKTADIIKPDGRGVFGVDTTEYGPLTSAIMGIGQVLEFVENCEDDPPYPITKSEILKVRREDTDCVYSKKMLSDLSRDIDLALEYGYLEEY